VFTPAQVVITLVLFAEASVILGIAAFPAVEVWLWISDRFPNAGAQRTLALCMGGAAAYFIFGLALLVVLPIARWVTLSIGTPVEFIERVVALAPDASSSFEWDGTHPRELARIRDLGDPPSGGSDPGPRTRAGPLRQDRGRPSACGEHVHGVVPPHHHP